jgi:transposase
MGTGVYFRGTTPAPRRLLFETWQATGDVDEACQTAHVGRRTFYYWKERFDAGGYAALEQYASRAPHHPPRTAAPVEQQVIDVRTTHPDWGKRRIADELAKAQGWVPLVSPNTVKRILRDAGLWETLTRPAKRGAFWRRPHRRGTGADGQRRSVLCAGDARGTAEAARGQWVVGAAGRHRPTGDDGRAHLARADLCGPRRGVCRRHARLCGRLDRAAAAAQPGEGADPGGTGGPQGGAAAVASPGDGPAGGAQGGASPTAAGRQDLAGPACRATQRARRASGAARAGD